MNTPTTRFSFAAAAASQRDPSGMSRKEGWTAMGMFAAQMVFFSLLWQTKNWPWDGIAVFGIETVQIITIFTLVGMASTYRGVHPRGYRRGLWMVGVWMVVVGGVASWVWMANGPHGTAPWITTLVAVVAVLPALILTSRLVRGGQ